MGAKYLLTVVIDNMTDLVQEVWWFWLESCHIGQICFFADGLLDAVG